MFSKQQVLSIAALVASGMITSAAHATLTATFTDSNGDTQSPASLVGTPSGGDLVIGGTTGTNVSMMNGLTTEVGIQAFTATSNSPSSTTVGKILGSSVNIINNSDATITLTINITDSNFISPTGSVQLQSFGTVNWGHGDANYFGSQPDSITETSALTGAASNSTSTTFTSPTSLSALLPTTTSTVVTPASAYSLANTLVVVLGSGDSVNVNYGTQVTGAVPEPTAASLMGMAGLGALILVGRRRKNVA